MFSVLRKEKLTSENVDLLRHFDRLLSHDVSDLRLRMCSPKCNFESTTLPMIFDEWALVEDFGFHLRGNNILWRLILFSELRSKYSMRTNDFLIH
jgi:hypothetical protein